MKRSTHPWGLVALLCALPSVTHAQQDPQYGNYPPPSYQPPPGAQPYQQPYQGQPYPGQPYQQPYPGQPYQGQPYQGQPYQQPYQGQPYQGQPYPGQYPSAQPYPGQPAPQPGAPMDPSQQPTQPYPGASPAVPKPDAKLTFTTNNEESRTALSSCFDALDHFRTELVRLRCADALDKDDKLTLAHALLSQASISPTVQKKHITAAKESPRTLSEGERLFVDGLVALAEDQRQVAKAVFEALVAQLPGEKRAYYYRGLLRYRFGDLDGAQTDFRKAIELDEKFGPAHNALGHLLLRRDNVDDAQKQFARYVELHPKEANALDSQAILHLRKGDLGLAVESARKAIELDAKFLRGNFRLGDALLLQGNLPLARRAYTALLSSPDPTEHHDAALRLSRTRLYEGLGIPTSKTLLDAEKDLQGELELSKKLNRRSDEVQTLLELARLQLERGAVTEAAKTLPLIREQLDATDSSSIGKDAKTDAAKPADKALLDKAAPTLSDDEKNRYRADLLWLRALLLHSVGERELATQRADEIEKTLKGKLGQRMAEDLRGDLAARSGDRQEVVAHLSNSTRPTSRWALALALGGGKPGEQLDLPKARTLMEELSKRNVVDLEGALTRGRAKQWLKQNPTDKLDAKPDARPDAKDKSESK
ncbi:MAG: tetratricopeptide repeat protein [Myxococcales bacterium]|nr:tetratricopeptide repeat protein [Myxococcales bacterium]